MYGDGIGYYAYLHSWYFDADADFTNEYSHLYNHQNNNSPEAKSAGVVQIVGTNARGQALNHFSPGMAILLLPFYVLADGVVVVANFFGASLARNGYSDVYQIASGIGAILYVVVAARLSERLLQSLKFTLLTSRVAVLLILLATSLLYYGSFDVLNSHFASFFLITLFLHNFYKRKHAFSSKRYFLLGVLAGLVSITRPQDAVISVVALLDIVLAVRAKKIHWRKAAQNLSLFFATQVVICIPLISQWVTTFDTPDSHPYFLWMSAGKGQSSLTDVVATFFHSTNGLFTRTPILLVAAGMFVYLSYKKKLSYFLQLLFVFFCLQYAIIVLQGGWKAAAYGGRMYISTLPLFMVLLAEFIRWIATKYSNRAALLILGFFTFLNIVSIASFVLLEKEASGNSRGVELYTLERIERLLSR
ncbi:MAG: hypothetical protein O2840_00465 [bacterium]|nr:hypothetical protein [bacterium]